MSERITQLTQRVVRRELHSSRAAPSIAAAVLISAFCLYVMFEAALKATGQDPWLVGPDQAAGWVGSLSDNVAAAPLVGAGLLVFIIGLLFFLNAVLPGRRARHTIPNPRTAIVVDAEVLASALARRARVAAGVTGDQVMVTVGRRAVEVQVRPTSGVPVDVEGVRSVVEDELRKTSVEPLPAVRVAVALSGVIGQ
ncbi:MULTISPECIES: DUF6286 domain-containing protein [unclassified Arthrobacter]|uniref:DUF6286 domain-containing protein n=1 Tax=unclassified Arthrobacter TaxID=235627 RepID=UPI001492D09C|nr:DUF6286 domain-containing protein [Arthrobacter sp. AET 35A]MBE0008309.1 hypothetical protein [Arthrobacter sp. AET 35A]NOJ62048.1 hypothetical protein [Arthrobacter sp. 147(2020)]